MKCPDCAEHIKNDARKCRFCGRQINDADRMGYPSFYSSILENGFCLDGILADYAEFVEPGGSGRINAENLVGYLFTWGELTEYDLLRDMHEALLNRAYVLYGEKDFKSRNIPHHGIEDKFCESGNEELKAVYLAARYLRPLADFGKLWPGREIQDVRKNRNCVVHAHETIKDLIVLAQKANPPLEDFVWEFNKEAEELEEILENIEHFEPGWATTKFLQENDNEEDPRDRVQIVDDPGTAARFEYNNEGRIHWTSTIKLMMLRGFVSGLVIVAIVSSFQAPTDILLMTPIILAIFGVPYALFLRLAGKVLGFFMPALELWFQFVGSLTVCIGDPIVYLINRLFPSLLGIPELRLIDFSPMIYVIRRD